MQSLAKLLSPEILAKAGGQLLEMSTIEKVPSVIVLLLQTVDVLGKNLDDKNFLENARIMYNTLLNDPDTDVNYYAKLYSAGKQ